MPEASVRGAIVVTVLKSTATTAVSLVLEASVG